MTVPFFCAGCQRADGDGHEPDCEEAKLPVVRFNPPSAVQLSCEGCKWRGSAESVDEAKEILESHASECSKNFPCPTKCGHCHCYLQVAHEKLFATTEILEDLLRELDSSLDLALAEPGARPHPYLEALHSRVLLAKRQWERQKIK